MRSDAPSPVADVEPDPGLLATAVRQALGETDADVGVWEGAPLSGGHTEADVYRLTGEARVQGRVRRWSLVLKRQAAPAPDGPTAAARDPRAPDYWRREAEAYRSGLLDAVAGVPGGLAPARCFGVEEDAGGVRLWLEDVAATADALDAPWPPERYGLAARHLGRLNGAYAEAGTPPTAARPIPPYDWLAPGFLGGWVAFLGQSTLDGVDVEPAAVRAHPLKWMSLLGDVAQGPLQSPAVWAHPRVQEAYTTPVAPRLLRLWEARETLLKRLSRLPQTLTHGDAKRNNLFSRPAPGGGAAPRPGGVPVAGEAQTVAVDWAFVGREALGEDAGHLLGNALTHAELPDAAARLDGAIFGGYLAGLRDAGWVGGAQAERAVRFAYTAHAALFVAVQLAADPVALVDERFRAWRFGNLPEAERGLEPLAARVAAHAFRAYAALDRADEAVALLGAL